jgi:hypothetical protein
MDESLQRVAAELGLMIVRRFAEGEFGATLVRRGDSELVLKVIDSVDWLPAVTRGSGIANRLRATGYPAPEYVGVGTFEESTWTLQRVLPGRVPDVMTEEHAKALVELVKRHAGQGETTFDWQAAAVEKTRESLANAREAVPDLVAELEQVVERTAGVELRRGDVVHSDFHHRNFLAEGDRVTGVFDWEIATPGDWRFDLVTLAFWTSVVPVGPREARQLVREATAAECEPETLALMTAVLAARQLDFDVRVHPDRVAGLQKALERQAPFWWRGVL